MKKSILCLDGMKIVAGLGNPGEKYLTTRHNFGFLAVDQIAGSLSQSLGDTKFSSECATVTLCGEKSLLLKPQTFMNLSGKSVAPAAVFFKVPHQDILVIHDDLDLPLGRIRFARGGTPAGHNGLKSIIEHLGSKDFCRLKLGIGRPVHPGQEVVDFVLQRFTKDEMKIVDAVLSHVPKMIECFVKHGVTQAMNECNGLNFFQE